MCTVLQSAIALPIFICFGGVPIAFILCAFLLQALEAINMRIRENALVSLRVFPTVPFGSGFGTSISWFISDFLLVIPVSMQRCKGNLSCVASYLP
jgi:hypothetical protein